MLTSTGFGPPQAEYTQRDDDETDYLQVKLREKWRLKAEAKRNVKAKLTAGDALDQMSMLISEGDYGGVRALLRDTIEDDAVHRVLLGYQPAAGGDAETVGGKEDARRAPLLQAADLGNREIVHALMQAGANARALDPQGRTASQVTLPSPPRPPLRPIRFRRASAPKRKRARAGCRLSLLGSTDDILSDGS